MVRFVSPFHYFNASRALVPDQGLDLPSGLALIAMTVTMLGAAASARQYLSFAAQIVVPIVTAYVLTQAAGWVADLKQGRLELILAGPAVLGGPDLAATPRAHVRRCRHHRRGNVRAGDRALAVGAHLDPLGLIRVFTDVLLFAAVFGAVAALVVAWLRGTAGGAGLAIFTAASYLLIYLVPLFGWPEWVARPSVFDAIGNPYL